MGIDVHHDAYRQQIIDKKDVSRIERIMKKSRRVKIGEGHGRIALLGNMLAGKHATPEKKRILGEYAEAYIAGRIKELGCTPTLAWIALIGQNRNSDVTIEERAAQLNRYRFRLTKDERHYHDDPGKSPVITPETFQHALNANPQQVLEDAENWAKVRKVWHDHAEAHIADMAHVEALVLPGDIPS